MAAGAHRGRHAGDSGGDHVAGGLCGHKRSQHDDQRHVAEALVFKGMKSILARLRPDAEIVMEIIPELSGQETVMGVFACEGWNAYALRPEDSIDNYFQPIKACAERIVDSVTVRTDVVFSRVATERIIYDS
jgi:hypothetical protein